MRWLGKLLLSWKWRLALPLVASAAVIAIVLLPDYRDWARKVAAYQPLSAEEGIECKTLAATVDANCEAQAKGSGLARSYVAQLCAIERMEGEHRRCLQVPPGPNPLVANAQVATLIFLALAIGGGLVLTSLALFAKEQIPGWRRITVLTTLVGGALAVGVWLSMASSVDEEAIAIATAIALLSFPIASLAVLGSRSAVAWVREGFDGGHVAPAPDPDVARVIVSSRAVRRESPHTDGAQEEARPSRGIGERYMWVVLAAWVAALPAAFVTAADTSSSLLAVLLKSVFGAFGAGLFAMVPGMLALLVLGRRSDGGLKAAIVVTLVVSALMAYVMIAPALRA